MLWLTITAKDPTGFILLDDLHHLPDVQADLRALLFLVVGDGHVLVQQQRVSWGWVSSWRDRGDSYGQLSWCPTTTTRGERSKRDWKRSKQESQSFSAESCEETNPHQISNAATPDTEQSGIIIKWLILRAFWTKISWLFCKAHLLEPKMI